MKHIRRISRGRVEKAQFESILEFVGLLNGIMSLVSNFMATFGISFSQKT
jgi:hypothetical protein